MAVLTTVLPRYRKLVAAVVGGIAEMVTAGVLHGTALVVATSIVAVATAAGVYTAPNAPIPAQLSSAK